MNFDPNGVGIANGNIFGFPVKESDADIILIPVPWDVTASYGKGTSRAPKAILDASTQLDFYHPKLDKAYNTQVFMSEISEEWLTINDQLTSKTIEYIQFLEDGGLLEANKYFQDVVDEVNEYTEALCNNLKERALKLVDNHKIVGVLGGEHAAPLGLIQAIDTQNKPFGILQIDAHADLRCAYESFNHSHASIMYNALKTCQNLVQLTQVGVRDIAESEVLYTQESNGRIKTFFDWDLKDEQFKGISWSQQVKSIIDTLPERVYISFDIDGLSPELCPKTGTPVPGGFKLAEINYLLFELANSNKKIVGFDLNEVGYSENNDWDANVGARVLWNLVCAVEINRKKHAL